MTGCVVEAPPPPGAAPDLGTDNGLVVDPNACEVVSVEATREAPSVLVLLDRSGSMYVPPLDRWTPAVSAINQVVGTHEAASPLGSASSVRAMAAAAGACAYPPGRARPRTSPAS